MPKSAVSVTLERTNLAWLEARARETRARSLSQALDDLITDARSTRSTEARSVAGTMTIAAADPGLDQADAVVRALFGTTTSAAASSPKRPGTRVRPAGASRLIRRASRRRG